MATSNQPNPPDSLGMTPEEIQKIREMREEMKQQSNTQSLINEIGEALDIGPIATPAAAKPKPKKKVTHRTIKSNGDLVDGVNLVVKPNQSFGQARAGSKGRVVAQHEDGVSVGVEVEGYKSGHDLEGALPPGSISGFWIDMTSAKNFFHIVDNLKPKIDFDSVILADKKKEQIIHALKQIDHHNLIFEQWGFGQTFEKGKGVSLLFYGPPGTGKTLMAQAIAAKLNYSLKIISSADIQSSVPGEAERNIREYFKDTKDQKSILLFDECDSLIYTRQSTGPILGAQVNELLSQLERFEGITVFTTNRLGTLDEAVNRRLSVKIEFPMPTQKERVKIWKRMFPEEAPLEGTIRWELLAKHAIPGGHIKNAVLRAVREAAVADLPDDEKTITYAHLSKGLKQEIAATNEFHKAKKQFEGKHRQVSGGMHDGGTIGLDNSINAKLEQKRELKAMRKSVTEMQNG